MITFILINAQQRTVERQDFESFEQALPAVGLQPGQIDFGALTPTLHLAVYEFGLFQPKKATSYFHIGRRLYAGNAVMFETDEDGVTVSSTSRILDPTKGGAIIALEDGRATRLRFLTGDQAETAMQMGEIDRPQMSVNNVLLWQWPEPRKT